MDFFRQKKVKLKDVCNNDDGTLECQIIDWTSANVDPSSPFGDKDSDSDSDGYHGGQENGDDEDNENNYNREFIIKGYGITKEGYSVCLYVTGFTPYFFVKVPSNWGDQYIKRFRNILEFRVDKKFRGGLLDLRLTKRKDFVGFSNDKLFNFALLVFKDQDSMRAYQRLFYRKIRVNPHNIKFQIYESNINPLLRFLHIRDINPAGWVKVDPKGKRVMKRQQKSRCQIELKVDWQSVMAMSKSDIAPAIIAGFDIECTSLDGSFPDASRKEDQVIQIGTTIHRAGEKKCFLKHIVTLKKCNPIEGAIVESYKTEREVLLAWQRFISKLDPDIITGYNIWGFDWNYLYARAKMFHCEHKFMHMGRMKREKSEFIEKRLSSSALGDNFLRYVETEGRVQIDMLKLVQAKHKLTSYKLKDVAKHFLKSAKIDLPPAKIFEYYQDGSAPKITEIAKYCIMDCVLCNELIMTLDVLVNNIAMANVSCIPFSYIFTRGQGVKIFSLVAKQCKKDNFLIPVIRKSDEDKGYEGAVVLKPKKAIYMDPISVMDYASLYPSSMIEKNISHDTIVLDPAYDNLPNYKYNEIEYDILKPHPEDVAKGKKKPRKIKTGVKKCRFAVKKDGDLGVLPRILQNLLQARRDTRRKIKFKNITLKNGKVLVGEVKEDEKDASLVTVSGEDKKKILVKKSDIVGKIVDTHTAFQKKVLDGQQLALKITCNSLYGQAGARTSPICLKELAASTTARGRQMIYLAKDRVEEKFPGTVTVYGDTDSIFVNFRKYIDAKYGTNLSEMEILQKSIDLNIEAAESVNEILDYPQNLEPEKTFYPLCLISKKRYVGNKYETDIKKYKQTSMGIILKRRDNAPIAKDIYAGVLDKILNERNIERAIKFYKDSVRDLLNEKVTTDKLIITKSIKAEYKDMTKIAHKVLACRMGIRDPGNAPASNDRVPYIYVDEKSLKCEVKGCKHKINVEACKCATCIGMYCTDHLPVKHHKCVARCRKCYGSAKSSGSSLVQCGKCLGMYCRQGHIGSHKCRKIHQKMLQGDRIEHPDYAHANKMKPDYRYYLDHQVVKPVGQIFKLASKKPKKILEEILRKSDNKRMGYQDITKWFGKA